MDKYSGAEAAVCAAAFVTQGAPVLPRSHNQALVGLLRLSRLQVEVVAMLL
jgi:hypothetical protein